MTGRGQKRRMDELEQMNKSFKMDSSLGIPEEDRDRQFPTTNPLNLPVGQIPPPQSSESGKTEVHSSHNKVSFELFQCAVCGVVG